MLPTDVVVTVTAATQPLFPATAISDRALICAVGATKYDRHELDPESVARCATVVCDDAVGSRHECGDLIHAAAHGSFVWESAIELRDVLAGNVTVARAGAAPVLFETQGVAIQDVAVAALAFERYIEQIRNQTHQHRRRSRMIQLNRLSMKKQRSRSTLHWLRRSNSASDR
jgi:ornithine cyclodeaminase/alanine dehydrogenase-like protein (mu-crystallin family)